MSLTKKIGEFSEKHLLHTAKDSVEKKCLGSRLLDPEAEERIPKFQERELELGRVLGRGGFCVVNEVTKISLMMEETDDPTEDHQLNLQLDDEHQIFNIVQDRNFMATHCIRSGRDCRYALKILQDSSKKDPHIFVSGVVDLAMEARFLSVIRHPNIIKMRAMSCDISNANHAHDGSLAAFENDRFFVVLDRLYDTLTVRINKWKTRNSHKGIKKIFDRKGKRKLAFWVERLTVAYDLTCALKYMHDLRVVYRDIKPDNIGFDVRGDVKIFDLGLAKELNCSKDLGNGNYELTGDTGSPRYMAPEVAQSKPYNEKVDVYSFSILLWQILQMETPFEGYTMSMFNKKVVEAGARPKCNEKWPDVITDLMKRGWGPPEGRPSMAEVMECLREEINKVSDSEVNEILDISRKSEMSLKGGNLGGLSSKKGPAPRSPTEWMT